MRALSLLRQVWVDTRIREERKVRASELAERPSLFSGSHSQPTVLGA